MKEDDVKLFFGKLEILAEKFNEISKELPIECCPDRRCYSVDEAAAQEFNDLSQQIYAEFTSAGYNDNDWRWLEQHSGAARRMGDAPKSRLG